MRGCVPFGNNLAIVSLRNRKPQSREDEVKFRDSALSVISVFCLALFIFAFAATTSVVSPAYADNSGGGPLPRDSVADTTGGPIGTNESGDESIIDAFMAVLNAIL